MSDYIVETENLTKQYGRQKALDSVNIRIAPGRIVGLIGPNGAGKTTLMKVLGGLVFPTEGSISLFGETGEKGLNHARTRASFMIETPYAKEHMKSMHYFAKRDIPLLVALITLLSVPVIAAFYSVAGGDTIRDMTGCRYVTGIAPNLSLFALIACMLISSRIAGADAGDKTLNYELLSGHGRAESYFGRAFAGLWWGGVLVFVLQWLPVVYFTICNGWGLEADMGDVALRCVP